MKSVYLHTMALGVLTTGLSLTVACGGDDDAGSAAMEIGADAGMATDTAGGGGGGAGSDSDAGSGGTDTDWSPDPDVGSSDASMGDDTMEPPMDAGSASDTSSDSGGAPDVGASDAGTGDESDAGSTFEEYEENDFVNAAEDPLATFSVDVDTASYTIMRRDVQAGYLPQTASVRVEEYLNFFDYDYEAPALDAEEPFAIHLESAPSAFGEGLDLFRIGIQGMEVPIDERLPANIVFLVDVSGSMDAPNKIELVKFALKTLVKSLRPTDTLAIVTYASREQVLLEPTAVENRAELYEAINRLDAAGSTAGEAGLRMAYEQAEAAFLEGGINRVVMCTDGDFNVGVTGEALFELVESWRDRDITITALGFGIGNDTTLEQIADRGNGNYGYIDSRNEVLRVLGSSLVSTLQVIAKDVKIQVAFNADIVERYRLVGYDNRVLEDWEFVDDTVDAAEIGAGHNVTAFLELDLYDDPDTSAELAEVRVRYKQPDGDVSTEVTRSFTVAEMGTNFEEASASFRFAAAVAEYAEILRVSMHSEGEQFDEVIRIAESATAERTTPDMDEFIELVGLASGYSR